MDTIDAVEGQAVKIPILLLKTKSTPHDGYEEYFSTVKEGKSLTFESVFVPVLKHGFRMDALDILRGLLQKGQISRREGAKYGGLIFTSQRAVEAFAKLVEEEDGHEGSDSSGTVQWPYVKNIPIYTVGPATSRALKSIPQLHVGNIFGSDTGNGEALAHYMLDHYGEWYANNFSKPHLLFLVGEQRRDIIPKTLMDPALPEEKRISVHELVIYETGVMDSFEQDFGQILKETDDREVRWVVVFSPTGCKAMLRALDMLDAVTGKVKTGERGGGCGNRRGKGRRSTYIATIGPTTRDYLRKTFGFEPDACAGQPSPEGIGSAIEVFMQKNYLDKAEN